MICREGFRWDAGRGSALLAPLLIGTLIISGCTASTSTRDAGGAEDASAGEQPDEISGPLSPEAARVDFRIDTTLRIDIFAAEPHVRDPVDLVFDAYGRAFVAEMLDYPADPASEHPPRSRIRLLEDADGDGRIDSSVVFADKIANLTGMQPWMDGLIVTAAPNILFLRDRDGDGRAEHRQTLFTGFALTNPQHIVSSPRLALDNWIYVANDGQPGDVCPVMFPSPAEAPCAAVLGADFRFRMVGTAYEAASGPAQFGQAFDAAGRRFIMHNTVHVRHVVLVREYLERNPLLPARSSVQDISDHGLSVYQATSPQDWRVARTDIRSRRYEAEQVGWTEHLEGHFTGVSGGVILLGSGLGDRYEGDLFVGEVAANLVHRDVLSNDGVSFTASRASDESDREFLVSTDPWFRPVNVTTGPDGSLYVIDMYREFIESPEYIPEAIRDSIDFYSGTAQGRIYRVRHRDHVSETPPVRPGHADAEGLVQMLAHPDQWWRLAAHRLLIERQDTSAIPLLRTVASSAELPASRIHTLYVLESLGALDEGVVDAALDDPAPEVLEHALFLAEAYPALAGDVVHLIGHPHPGVRFQAALTAGSLPVEDAVNALTSYAVSNMSDPWPITAVLTAHPRTHAPLLARLLDDGILFRGAGSDLLHGFASVIGAGANPDDIQWLINQLATDALRSRPTFRAAAADGLSAGLKLAGIRRLDLPEVEDVLLSLVGEADAVSLDQQSEKKSFRAALQGLADRILLPERAAMAAAASLNPAFTVGERVDAADRLAGGAYANVKPVLDTLLDGTPHLQSAALRVLSTFAEEEVADLILSNWAQLTASGRLQAMRILAGRVAWTGSLLAASEAGLVDPGTADPQVRLRLLDNPRAAIRRRAATVFQEAPARAVVEDRGRLSVDREGVLTDRDAVLSLTGDADAGRSVFYARCASCHLPTPAAVGPNLLGVSNKSRAQLLEAIVAPSRAIPGSYAAYVAELSDSSIVSGRIVSEGPGTITFRNLDGDQPVLRSRIARIRQAERSLMPFEAAEDLEPQQLADLIAFLRAARE